MKETLTSTSLSAGSLALFTAICDDFGNWAGTPPTFDFIEGKNDPNKGHLTDLKRRKLVATYRDDGNEWIRFLDAGRDLAVSLGFKHIA